MNKRVEKNTHAQKVSMRRISLTNEAAPSFYIGFLAFITFNLVNNLVGILYIIFNVFLYTVVVFLVKGKIYE